MGHLLIHTAAVVAVMAIPVGAASQEQPAHFGDEFLSQFNASAEKIVALANAMPAESYSWQPMEGAYTVAAAYMHIARYNYMYPDVGLGVEPDVEYEAWAEDVTEKDQAVEILARSMEHVRRIAKGMSSADLERTTRFYRRDVQQWVVLFQLLTHMNEHLGQQIAYARMNRVVPPWSL